VHIFYIWESNPKPWHHTLVAPHSTNCAIQDRVSYAVHWYVGGHSRTWSQPRVLSLRWDTAILKVLISDWNNQTTLAQNCHWTFTYPSTAVQQKYIYFAVLSNIWWGVIRRPTDDDNTFPLDWSVLLVKNVLSQTPLTVEPKNVPANCDRSSIIHSTAITAL
jgi:hypothetical protein